MSVEPGTLIILNGTSSSGKSSLARALQRALEAPYLEMGLDRYIWSLPGRYLDTPLWDDVLGRASHAGATGDLMVRGMHAAFGALLDTGLNVVADHVLVEPAWVTDLARAVDGRAAWLVGVHCPLDVLEAREAARGDRTLGQARKQFDRVHAHGRYDITVDTSVDPVERCAEIVLERMVALGRPAVLDVLREGRGDG